MKKFFYLAVAACAALAACSKNEVTPVDVDQQITFQAVVNKASTKAGSTFDKSSSYPTNLSFGTVAYLETASPVTVYIDTKEVSYNSTNNYWSTADPYYWPIQGSLAFMSYSPFKYQEGGSPAAIAVSHEYNKLKIDNYNVASHQDTDLMVADIKKGQKANSTQDGGTWVKGVPTVFHHKLSQVIGIDFQTVDTENPSTVKDYANGNSETGNYNAGDQQFFINEVAFKDVFFEGSYSYNGTSETATESWTNGSTSVTNTEWFKETNACQEGKFVAGKFATNYNTSNSSANKFLLILPQAFEDPETATNIPSLYIKYTVRTYYSATGYSTEEIESTIPLYNIHSSDHKWDMNKIIKYTISLSKQRIFWDPKVTDWDETSLSFQI